ncbi:hypothetical protein L3V82_07665 [Thiotrichales bacterium 19S3-7]|nr:hypothetical protein [Thiotrichales bacterium 19S3-7]MCF6802035.1 hypothetical protein [Thiotrichales bacterium 19S3-11]
MKNYILLVICGILLSINSYAGTTFKFTLRNTSKYDVKLSEGNWKCIKMLVNFPNNKILSSDKEVTFSAQDDGAEGNGCEGHEKHFSIYYQFVDQNNLAIGDKKEVQWKHYKKSGSWGFIVDGETQGNLILHSASCKGKDCKNKWVSGNDGDQFIETTDGFGKYVSIGLGDIVVTDGVGKQLGLTDVDLGSVDDVYIFHFSKTQEVCRYTNKMITCDNGVGSTFRSDSFVFFCRQAYPSDASCPWASVSNSVNYSNAAVNIY